MKVPKALNERGRGKLIYLFVNLEVGNGYSEKFLWY